MNSLFAHFRDFLEISEGIGAAGVGSRNGRPFGKLDDQFLIYTAAKTFDIDRVDEKLGAPGGQHFQIFPCNDQVGELLPAVSNDNIVGALATAAQIEDQAFFANE